MSEKKEWLEKIKSAVKNEEETIEHKEFQEFLDAVSKLENDKEAQEEANQILEDFTLKAQDVTDQVMDDKQLVEFDENRWKYFQKMMKKVPWSGETMELLLAAFNLVDEARKEARSGDKDSDSIGLTGKELYTVLEQFNKIEGQGIDRASKFYELYKAFAEPFVRFRDIKSRNDRVIQRYESEIQDKIKEISKSVKDKDNSKDSETEMELVDNE